MIELESGVIVEYVVDGRRIRVKKESQNNGEIQD
jgi:hypothetical protein